MFNGEEAVFRRLVVLLDGSAPRQGAFARALDWACRLRLPILAISPPWLRLGRAGPDDEPELVHACERACAAFAVPCEFCRWEDRALTGLQRILGPGDLCVFGHAVPLAQKRYLLRHCLGCAAPPVLVCTEADTRLTRVLLFVSGSRPPKPFLVRGVQLCRQLVVRPVVLTAARSERAARQLQDVARETMAGFELGCDFDLLVGFDVPATVASIARWRKCQLVVLEQHASPAWWRWLRASPAERLIALDDSLDFLALPEVGVPVPEANALPPALASAESRH